MTVTMTQTKSPLPEASPPGGIAHLSVINYKKLANNDPEESAKLFSACLEWGFFYLDLAFDETEAYRASVDRLKDFSIDYFSRPLEEKIRDTNDAWETFNICG